MPHSSAMVKRRPANQSTVLLRLFLVCVIGSLAFRSYEPSTQTAFSAPAPAIRTAQLTEGSQALRRDAPLRPPVFSGDRHQKVRAPSSSRPQKTGLNAGPVAKASIAVGLAIVGTWFTTHEVAWLPDGIGVRRFLHIPIKEITRLNERWFGPVNFDRANLRITAMDTYALVAAFLLQIIMALFTTINGQKPDADAGRLTHIMYDFQVFFTSTAALFSTWTMVMFLFNKVFCVKAIAVYHDVNYDVFVSATRRYRIRAFQSLIAALVSYIIAYAAVLFTTLGPRKGMIGFWLCILFGFIMSLECKNLIADAEAFAGAKAQYSLES